MLATQVQYWNYVENKRHNMATEEQARQDLIELSRSNRVREGISRSSLDESVRHNKASESLGWGNLSEVGRHNVAEEQIGFSNINELSRHNQATETLLPYQQGNYQMQTTTGYVNAGVNAGDKIGVTPFGKAGVAGTTIAGMLIGSDISSSRKGGPTYGQFSSAGTSHRKGSVSHYSNRPTLSDADRNKYFHY